jgi:putative oxidoreductase
MATEVKVQDRSAVDVALLIARVIVGVVFMAHGAQKLFGAFGGPGLSAFVQMMGPLGYLVAIGEFFGGLGLVVGFLTRFSAASITLIMLGAIGMVHVHVGFFMNWTGKQAGEGFEYHLLAIAVLLTIAIAGPGRFVIGAFFLCRNQREATAPWRYLNSSQNLPPQVDV